MASSESPPNVRDVIETLGRTGERTNVCVARATVEYDDRRPTPYPVSGCIVGVPRHIGHPGFSLTGHSFSTRVRWEDVQDVAPRGEAPSPCPHCGSTA